MEKHSNLYYILQWDAQRNPCPPKVMEQIKRTLLVLLLQTKKAQKR